MNKSLLLLTIILILPFVSSLPNLQIEKIDKGAVIISELDNPAVFDFEITNNGDKDDYEIYTLVGVSMAPRGFFELPAGKTTIEVRAWPSEEIRKREGFFNFKYNLRGQQSGILEDTLRIKIVKLENVFEIEPQQLTISDTNAVIAMRNKENTHLENVNIQFDSAFFSTSKEVSLNPYEEKEFSIPINQEKSKKVAAGQYIVTSTISVKGKEIQEEGIIEYVEKEMTYSEKSSSGVIIKKTTLKETNEGNTPKIASMELKKDVISRLFTTSSQQPLDIKRSGFYVTYSWEKVLNPDENFEVKVTTNYTFPFILLLLIIVVIIFGRIHALTALSLTKKVSHVRTKGGEFALKVTIRAKARKHVDNVQIIDSLPGMTKIYEKFGKKPDKIDNQTRRIFWNMEKITRGEVRVFSYIIYSKVNIIGRFELPSAAAIYESNGKTQEVFSNKTYFAAEKI